MEDKTNSNVAIYCVYAILYANDMSCNLIKDLAVFIKDMDKETKKIYCALMKRIRNYDTSLNKIIGNSFEFFADYNDNMDEINDECLFNFRNSIVKFYESLKFKDYEFLGYLEAAHTSLTFSENVMTVVLEVAKKRGMDIEYLRTYNLCELKKIMDNLSYWCYRHVRKTMNESINLFEDKDIIVSFAKMNENLLNYDVFEKCYSKTVNERNEDYAIRGKNNDTFASSEDA